MQPKVDNEIFAQLIKCNRSGYYASIKPEKVILDKLIQMKILKNEMAHCLSNSVKNEGGFIKINTKISVLNNKLEAICDCLITANGKTDLYCCFPVNYKLTNYEIHQAAYIYFITQLSQLKIDRVIAVRYKNSKDLEIECSEDNLYYDHITKSVVNSKRQKMVSEQIDDLFHNIRNNSAPKFSPHHYCLKPFICPLKKYCFEKGFGKEENIFDLNDTKFSLMLRMHWKGITKIEDIEKSQVLPKRTNRQIDVYKAKKEKTIFPDIQERFKNINRQEDFIGLDIDYCEILNGESYANKTTNRFPFVFTIHHYQNDINSSLEYSEITVKKPDFESAKELINKFIEIIGIYENLKIVVYNKNKTFGPLIGLFDKDSFEYYHLSRISSKIFDLYEIFLNKEYYHPEFKGSAYLKNISRITAPEVYSDDDFINSGIQVENYFKKCTAGGKALEINNISEIYKYLTRDTTAIVKTFIFLKNKL